MKGSEHRPPVTPLQARDLVLLACAAAMVAATGLVAWAEYRYRVLHMITWTSREFAWLSPIGHLMLFLPLAGVLLVVAKVFPRLVTLGVATTIFATLAIFSVFLLYPHLHPLAELALAIGLATRLGVVIGANRAVWMPRVRMTTIAFAVLLATAGVITGAARRVREQWTLARLPQAAADAPNVVLLIMDTVRASELSAYGFARPTSPELERLAADGVLFERAISTAPWTGPSHASMMTGLWASQTRADYLSPMTRDAPTLAATLGADGYATGGFVANAGYAGYQMGISRDFSHFEDFPISWQQALWSTTLMQTNSGRLFLTGIVTRHKYMLWNAVRRLDLRVLRVQEDQKQPAATIVDNFLHWRSRVGGGPWFALLNFFDAHSPYDSPTEFHDRFSEGKDFRDRYDGAIAYEDSIIGQLARRLTADGSGRPTILIITSDHGEQWGEHGLDGHANSLYLPLLHVPLIVYAPGHLPPGRHVTSLVTLRDLAATIAALAGVRAHHLAGTSLVPTWTEGTGADPSPIVAEVAAGINVPPDNPTSRGPIKSAMDSTWQYIRYGDGVEELFAWRTDSAEAVNLAAAPASAAVIDRLRKQVAHAIGETWPPLPHH